MWRQEFWRYAIPPQTYNAAVKNVSFCEITAALYTFFCSVPCNKTAPMPTPDASHSSSKVLAKFGKARMSALVSWAFILLKACSCFSFQQNGVSFFTNSLSGEARLEKLMEEGQAPLQRRSNTKTYGANYKGNGQEAWWGLGHCHWWQRNLP